MGEGLVDKNFHIMVLLVVFKAGVLRDTHFTNGGLDKISFFIAVTNVPENHGSDSGVIVLWVR